jgi:hypothetical protein
VPLVPTHIPVSMSDNFQLHTTKQFVVRICLIQEYKIKIVKVMTVIVKNQHCRWITTHTLIKLTFRLRHAAVLFLK